MEQHIKLKENKMKWRYERKCPKCKSFFLNVTWLPFVTCAECGHVWKARRTYKRRKQE